MIHLQGIGITLVLIVVFALLTIREQRIQDELNKED
jgi:hypothetical protein